MAKTSGPQVGLPRQEAPVRSVNYTDERGQRVRLRDKAGSCQAARPEHRSEDVSPVKWLRDNLLSKQQRHTYRRQREHCGCSMYKCLITFLFDLVLQRIKTASLLWLCSPGPQWPHAEAWRAACGCCVGLAKLRATPAKHSWNLPGDRPGGHSLTYC